MVVVHKNSLSNLTELENLQWRLEEIAQIHDPDYIKSKFP